MHAAGVNEVMRAGALRRYFLLCCGDVRCVYGDSGAAGVFIISGENQVSARNRQKSKQSVDRGIGDEDSRTKIRRLIFGS